MHALGVQFRGLVDTVRMGRVPARALAIADSRSLVRSMFLASAVQIELLPYLRSGRPFSAIVDHTGCTRPDRLRAWLWIGSELGELSRQGEVFGVRGRETFVFSQPRPVARATSAPGASLDDLAALVEAEFAPHFTALESDLDAFATSPVP